MPTLADLARSLDSRPVILRGREYPVRALPIAVTNAIRNAFTLPDAPLAPPRGRGSAAAWAPDYDAPEYRAAELEWYRKVHVVEAMAALGFAARVGDAVLEVPDFGGPQSAWDAYAATAWADGSSPRGLTNAEVSRVLGVLASIDEGEVLDDAKKSSTPPTASAPSSR